MQGYYIKTVGQHRGSPRVWLEGSQTERAGFVPGQRYDIEVQGQMVVLQANKDGSRVVSGKVVGEKNNPVIDINSKALLAIFDGMAAIRVVVKQDQIYLMPLASEIKKRERYVRLRDKLESGDLIAIGSLSHGGGVLSHAIHSGLEKAGINSKLAFANEIRGELLEHAAIHNDAWSRDTQILAAPMQELAFDDRGVASIPKIDVLELGLPCSGASKAGRSKRALIHPEAHPHVGHLVVAALVIVSKTNPAIVIMENVVEYSQSASADILRNQFRDLGYNTSERVLNGKEWGSLENRNRWCMIAVTHGIEFDFDQLQPPGASAQLIADVLDKSIGPDDPKWRSFDYLKTKEIRDEAKGNSFSMQVVTPEGNSVPVLRKGYAKGGSTDALLQHPDNPDLLRQFTAAEHSRIKGVPEALVNGLSNVIAHEILGQGIVYQPFEDVGAHVGDALRRFVGQDVVQRRPAVQVVDIDAQRAGVVAEEVEPAPVLVAVDKGPLQLDLLSAIELPTVAVVSKGIHSGRVLSVEDGIVVQKVNREGRTEIHDLRALSMPVEVGQIVDIKYVGGVGQVGGLAVSKGWER
ncbi:DNA cytosine methyltransferase [Janthinobacterium sp. CAN_S7]|uniref:DNA cytosine methyltransferase n=1 Tax=Janthinobacterium sp. CAN_S7 TaxID=3071704 RepID=UPI00319E58AE